MEVTVSINVGIYGGSYFTSQKVSLYGIQMKIDCNALIRHVPVVNKSNNHIQIF